ncbi:MAG: hypothetical protein JWN96_3856, partial [Mycobacterium sp.]|nr:hypothetical protein [Mycobacterium sp.]
MSDVIRDAGLSAGDLAAVLPDGFFLKLLFVSPRDHMGQQQLVCAGVVRGLTGVVTTHVNA